MTPEILSAETVKTRLEQAFEQDYWQGKRVLVLIPDGTRTASIPMLYDLLYQVLGERITRLDYLVALGTHRAMSDAAIDTLTGLSAFERARRYPKSQIYDHEWWNPDTFFQVGTISADEMTYLTQGLMSEAVDVTINKMILAYDHIFICGPVFPHEVAGFSGGAKYLFPGIAGTDIINKTHWLGALATSLETIGVEDTAVRRVLHKAAHIVQGHRPLTLLAQVMSGSDLCGLFIGDVFTAWSEAVDLSAQVNIRYYDKPFQTVLSMPSEMYEDLWTAAKAMYKTEPVVADGGEVIIYAPHVKEVSFSHGEHIKDVGYHVRDYFVKQWEQFKEVPGGVLAHSTHVKGSGTFENGVEQPRITVTLATGIPEVVCQQINLGYRDPNSINPADYASRESEGVLLVEHAGEYLYRLKPTSEEDSA